MAMNDRIETTSGDVDYGQLAPSKALRTSFTPGKASSEPGDMNWPKDNRIPTGTPAFDGESAGPVEMERVRVARLGRGTVCDQTLPIPVVLDVRVETRTEVGVAGANTTKDTEMPRRVSDWERNAGNDNIAEA